MPAGSVPTMTEPPTERLTGAGPGLQLLHFAGGLPGFPASRVFQFVDLEPDLAPFRLLRCLDTPGVEFVVAPPGRLFTDYLVDVDPATSAHLGLGEPAATAVWLVVNVGAGAPTVNLLGPVVVNVATGSAAQVVQVAQRPGYGAAVPLPLEPPVPVPSGTP